MSGFFTKFYTSTKTPTVITEKKKKNKAYYNQVVKGKKSSEKYNTLMAAKGKRHIIFRKANMRMTPNSSPDTAIQKTVE